MISLYLLFLIVFSVLVLLLFFRRKKPIDSPENNRLKDISVIIPFRNEEKNLSFLLKSFEKQRCLPEEIILVNDHSEDSSIEFIQKYSKIKGIKVIHLDNTKKGKKEALNCGIKNAIHPYILTFDADVILSDGYFEELQKKQKVNMMILPVIMKGKSFLGNFFSTEYLFFNAFNFLMKDFYPISISGANLLFRTASIDYEEQLKEHIHLSSGDDYFLLKTFRTKKRSITVENDALVAVTTQSPETIGEYLNQRVRWLSKSKYNIKSIEAITGFLITLYLVLGPIVLLMLLLTSNWGMFLVILIYRLLLDSFIFLHYSARLKQSKMIVYIPLFQLVYPFLFLIVVLFSFVYKPTWKGRSL